MSQESQNNPVIPGDKTGQIHVVEKILLRKTENTFYYTRKVNNVTHYILASSETEILKTLGKLLE